MKAQFLPGFLEFLLQFRLGPLVFRQFCLQLAPALRVFRSLFLALQGSLDLVVLGQGRLQLDPALGVLRRPQSDCLAPCVLRRQCFLQTGRLLVHFGPCGLQVLFSCLQGGSLPAGALLVSSFLLLQLLQFTKQPGVRFVVPGQFRLEVSLALGQLPGLLLSFRAPRRFNLQLLRKPFRFFLHRRESRLQFGHPSFEPGAFASPFLRQGVEPPPRLLQLPLSPRQLFGRFRGFPPQLRLPPRCFLHLALENFPTARHRCQLLSERLNVSFRGRLTDLKLLRLRRQLVLALPCPGLEFRQLASRGFQLRLQSLARLLVFLQLGLQSQQFGRILRRPQLEFKRRLGTLDLA